MGKKERHQQALQILAERRQACAKTQERRHLEIVEKIPAIVTLEQRLAETTIVLTKHFLGKKDGLTEMLEQMKQQNLSIQMQMAELLFAAGFPSEYLLEQHACALCQDTGFVAGKRCRCLETLLGQLALKELSYQVGGKIPSFGDFSLSFYQNQDATMMSEILKFCKQYAQQFQSSAPSVLLMGATGLGKTHLSLAMGKEILQKGYDVSYLHAQDFFAQMQRMQFSRGDTAQHKQNIEQIGQAELVILDDLGAEHNNAFHTSIFYHLLNGRLQQNKAMIVSTNLSPKELEIRYGARIASRLMTQFKCLKFCGQDVRQQQLTMNETIF